MDSINLLTVVAHEKIMESCENRVVRRSKNRSHSRRVKEQRSRALRTVISYIRRRRYERTRCHCRNYAIFFDFSTNYFLEKDCKIDMSII